LAEAFLGGVEMGALTFDVIKDYVDAIELVSETSVAEAIKLLWKKEGQIVEGAGATSICPILESPENYEGRRVVSVVSGGNIESRLFESIIE
jgi:threonine dehydratase